MNKTDYNIVGLDGSVKNWFLQPLRIYDSAGTLKLIREGDFMYNASGTALPNLRFDSMPFGGRVSSSNMIFQFGINDTLLTTSPKVACLGSSTMAGHGLSSPNRLEDRLNAWLTANTTTPTLTNLAVEGYTMANLRTVANGGTSGQNIEAAVALNPTFIYVDEPSNWANVYDEATQVSYMLEIFTYAFQRGILVIFSGSRPRTPYSGTQDTRLVNLNALLSAHRSLKFVSLVNFSLFLQSSTVADLRTDYDQGDGIHMNATGVQALANSITAWWQKVFYAVTAFNQYVMERSADSGTTWATFQTITDMSVKNAVSTAITGLYRIKARLKDNTTFTDVSATASITAPNPQRVLIDLGGDGILDGAQTDGGVMVPNNTIASGTPGQDAGGNWWNNIVDGRPTVAIGGFVDTTNMSVLLMTLMWDKTPRGTFSAVDYSMNYNGYTTAAISDYPISAIRDNLYFHTTAGVVTMTFVIPTGRTASIKFWGNRTESPGTSRILQFKGPLDATFAQEYNASNNLDYNTAVIFTGLVGTVAIQAQVKSGSTFGHISVIDITLT